MLNSWLYRVGKIELTCSGRFGCCCYGAMVGMCRTALVCLAVFGSTRQIELFEM